IRSNFGNSSTKYSRGLSSLEGVSLFEVDAPSSLRTEQRSSTASTGRMSLGVSSPEGPFVGLWGVLNLLLIRIRESISSIGNIITILSLQSSKGGKLGAVFVSRRSSRIRRFLNSSPESRMGRLSVTNCMRVREKNRTSPRADNP